MGTALGLARALGKTRLPTPKVGSQQRLTALGANLGQAGAPEGGEGAPPASPWSKMLIPIPPKTRLLGKHRNRSSLANSPFTGRSTHPALPPLAPLGSRIQGRSPTCCRGPGGWFGVLQPPLPSWGSGDAEPPAGSQGQLSPGPGSSPLAALPAAM